MSVRRFGRALVWLAVGCAAACSDSTGTGAGGNGLDALARSGGAMTVFDATSNAFRLPAPNLAADRLQRHADGDVQFDATFVAAPAPANGGLGPLFNNTSCLGCHVNGGRGRPPTEGEELTSMLLRASVTGAEEHGGPLAAPGVGLQLQLKAIAGFAPEAAASIRYDDSVGYFGDGTRYTLRRPLYQVTGVDGPLPGGLLLSPRVAPPVFGLGLLEAVDEATILAAADPDDRNGDDISGRANYVWDEVSGRVALGRFGWKANVATLLEQTAAAYNGDMGVTSSFFPAEPCEGVPGCERHDPEVSDDVVRLARDYVATLGVPARRDLDVVLPRRGERIFRNIGCGSCHLPEMRTGNVPGAPEVSNQVIRPYTDLLLHDMGPGLADGRPDYLATPAEWRTPPLWGIGLTMVAGGHTSFLHDGRARDLLEAILWHDGEAARSKRLVLLMAKGDRDALLAFLGSL